MISPLKKWGKRLGGCKPIALYLQKTWTEKQKGKNKNQNPFEVLDHTVNCYQFLRTISVCLIPVWSTKSHEMTNFLRWVDKLRLDHTARKN